jgi:hypothetical protein
VSSSILPSKATVISAVSGALIAAACLGHATTRAKAQAANGPPATSVAPREIPKVSIGRLPTPNPTGILSTIERGFDTPSKAIAQTVENVISLLGSPNAYVVGNDVSGAFLVGGRYGTGVMHSVVAAPSPIRWRAVSLGLGLGANYGRVVMLVYGLDKLEDVFGLYGSLEGNLHVGLGANTTVITSGAVTIVIVSSGLGLRLSGDAGGIYIDPER